MKKKKYIFWILLVSFFGIFFIREQYILYKLSNVQKTYQDQLAKIKIQSGQLKSELNLTKRSDYFENIAREKLGLVKPGEILFVDQNKKR